MPLFEVSGAAMAECYSRNLKIGMGFGWAQWPRYFRMLFVTRELLRINIFITREGARGFAVFMIRRSVY